MSWDHGDYFQIRFSIGRSRRYHSMMRDFYRRLADLVTAIGAVSGTSAFVALFLSDRSSLLAKWLTGVIATASILNLVFGFGKKADLHDKLCKDFTKLASEMISLPANKQNLLAICAKRILIEVDEPTVRRVIDLRAAREEERASGISPDKLLPLTWLQERTPLGYFCDFDLAEVQKRLAKRASECRSA
ncbi:hypothetical protein [Caulobacter sp. BE254]|uniref:hypothetical protein n=1 Tax=Caulobacter sp. BE254 TaxID=2817720 RepID=UPI00285FF14F|nr:hypothetical protein [Caulobacter sp. BE254]MDR7119025.1 hypothetical protein [Caulobacter sp. BE254]